MRRTLIALSLVLALSTGIAFAQTFGAVLTASQETPPTTTPGFGNATVSFVDSTHIKVDISVANLGSPISAFHIHNGAAGVAGGVKVDLIGLGGTFSGGKLSGTFPIDSATATDLIANPQNYYVNIHTTQFPLGAIRGQLSPAASNVITYAAELRPQNEVPPVTSNAFGSALVTFDFNNSTITWEVTTSGIVSPTLSHIHRGAAGVAGQVIINFATGPTDIPGGRTKGSATIASRQTANLTAADLTNLQSASTANGYYVNVHSTLAPGGEIRGQLVPANEAEIPVAGKVNTFVTDARVFNPSYTTPITAMLEFFPTNTTTNTNASSTMVVNIPARGTATLNDVTGASNLNASAALGSIRVSSATAFNSSSKIYSDLRPTNQGTLGQFTAGIPRANALRRGVLPQLEQDADFRTNLGFFNPNSASVTVRLELRDDAGNLVGQSTQTFAGLFHTQQLITNFFPGVDLSNAQKLTLTFDASAPIDVYAAVNDNKSTDAFVVVPQEDTGVAANQQ